MITVLWQILWNYLFFCFDLKIFIYLFRIYCWSLWFFYLNFSIAVSSPPCLPDLYCSCSGMDRETSCFVVEPAPVERERERERRHSHIPVPDRESPPSRNEEKWIGFVVGLSFSPKWIGWGAGFTKRESLMRGTDKCLYFLRWQFSVPRCNAHWTERLMGKEMKLKTRSQLRRVIGKVCSNGSLWDVRPCCSCRYRPGEEEVGTISLCEGKD